MNNLLQQLMTMSDPSHMHQFNMDSGLNLPLMRHIKDPNSKYIECNTLMSHATGFKAASDMIGLLDYDLDFISRETAESFRKADAIVQATGEPKIFIDHYPIYDGRLITGIAHKAPLRSRTKKIIGTICYTLMIDSEGNNIIKSPSIEKEKNSTNLTDRQISCLTHLIKGKSHKQIAKELHLSPRTVEHYLDAIKLKLNCYTRSELISKSLQIPAITERL
jgi:DNA-binding CsgD family transcriptional regulator